MSGDASGPESVETIVARAAGGDERAWGDLVARYARRVFALVRSRGVGGELAEEVTQSVFVTVAEKLSGRGYAERGSFEAWLFRVAMNRLRDEMRRRARHAVASDPVVFDGREGGEADPGALEDEGGGGEVRALRSAMGRLSDADREVVELRHHGQMSFADIASLLGEPIGTVLARHHRALKKLRTMIEDGSAEAGARA